MLNSPARDPLIRGMAIAAVLVLGWFIYQPALSSVFLLDDRPNLSGLAAVTDAETALQFTFSGSAGPVGRPLALATFLPQADLWGEGEDAAPFIRVNILIHLLNGLLAYFFFLQLSRARRIDRTDDQLLAIAAMALWLFLPILASSSLMVIQRMTTLAATFMLLGLNAYLYARAQIDTRPDRALIGMSTAVIVATLLAVLTKENGALLPSLILVLEATLLQRPQNLALRKWRVWNWLFLAAPTLLVIGFLINQVPYDEIAVLKKDLTAWERLLTQARILWEYLLASISASPIRVGPFRDGYPVARSLFDPFTFIAVFAWLATISGALVWRRKYPMAAFALLWFITAHLLESTTINLELYFEHRNYVPLIGPAFALCSMLLAVVGEYRKFARAALALYILVNAAVLFSVTSLWGNPLGAASYWYLSFPHSARAAAHLSAQQMVNISAPTGIITLQEFAGRHPDHAYLRLHEMTSSCRVSPERDHTAMVEYLKTNLPSIQFTLAVGSMLDDLLFAISTDACNGVDNEVGKELAIAVYSNPRYASDRIYSNFHHRLLARIALDAGNMDVVMYHLTQAQSIMPSDRLDEIMVRILAADGRFEDARRYIDQATDDLPRHPFRRIAGKIMLKQLRREVDEAELGAQSGT